MQFQCRRHEQAHNRARLFANAQRVDYFILRDIKKDGRGIRHYRLMRESDYNYSRHKHIYEFIERISKNAISEDYAKERARITDQFHA